MLAIDHLLLCTFSITLFFILAFIGPRTRWVPIGGLRAAFAGRQQPSTAPTKLDTKRCDLVKTVPPQRRSALDGNFELGSRRQGALLDPVTCVPDASDVLDPSCLDLLTPTGFTMAEIEAVGRFPDYAALSGVPAPAPYLDFNIKQALPRPYRPLRWPYHQTMGRKVPDPRQPRLTIITGLARMEPDWWLELESTYVSRIQQRLDLLAKHGDMIMNALPGTELACREAMELALQFLCTRYPHYFRLNPTTSPTTFHNLILHTTTDLLSTRPLQVLISNIPEDFVLMLRSPATGLYTFRAGIITSALGFSVSSKLSLPLSEIHSPVPHYATKMSLSMNRFFARLPTDHPIQRGSWSLEVDEPLFQTSDELPVIQDPDLTLDRATLRVDWQTVRRLPLSGAVLFNFKALFTPIPALRDEPGLPGLLLKILREGDREILGYKNTWHVEHVVVPALEEMDRYQRDKGMVEEGWEAETLEESPFFPGWREKWIREQGFAPPE